MDKIKVLEDAIEIFDYDKLNSQFEIRRAEQLKEVMSRYYRNDLSFKIPENLQEEFKLKKLAEMLSKYSEEDLEKMTRMYDNWKKGGEYD